MYSLGWLTSYGQDTKIAFSAHYTYQFPMGDLSKFYGNNSNIGGNLNIKFVNNFTLGVEGQFLFASQYKDLSLLGNMVTSDGFIIGKNESIETPQVEGRGGNFFVEVGKIFPLNKSNLNSGLHVKAGLGYIFYSAYVNVDPNVVTQLKDNYPNGYSRLQSGMSVNTFVGYTLYGKDKLINGSAGLQLTYASMKYDGNIDYATSLPIDKTSFSNFLLGPKISFSLLLKTIKKQDPKSDGYFYN